MKQKHMTKEMRERIEKGIREGESLKEIAKAIDKDTTTISKEVLKRRSDVVQEYHVIPFSFCSRCLNLSNCKLRKVCDSKKCNNENAVTATKLIQQANVNYSKKQFVKGQIDSHVFVMDALLEKMSLTKIRIHSYVSSKEL